MKSNVELIVEMRPEMLKVIRLSASGIASVIGFNLEQIEDIKVAVSEVCNMLISKCSESKVKILFDISEDNLNIIFSFIDEKPNNFSLFNSEEDVLAEAILDALVDSTKIIHNNSGIISLSVSVKEI